MTNTHTNYDTNGKPYEVTYYSTAETAKFVREALKKAFPTVKFSVRSDNYSMGSSIRVGWYDGPTEKEVSKITHAFEGSQMEQNGGDSIKAGRKDTRDPVTGKPCRYGADWVTPSRIYTMDFFKPIAERVAKEWGVTETLIFAEDEYMGAHLGQSIRMDNGEYFESLVRKEIDGISGLNTKQIKAVSVAACQPVVNKITASPVEVLTASDFDYTWQGDTNIYPFESIDLGVFYICDVCGLEATTDITHSGGHTMHQECYRSVLAYDERVQRRFDRLSAYADRVQVAATAEHDRARKMADGIPFGQPVLVGHYSEGRDRRYRARIERTFQRSWEQYKRAEQLRQRANARSRAISSDDPAAVMELKEKLENLESLQADMVRINAIVRKLIQKPRETAAQKEAKRLAHIAAMNSGNAREALNAIGRAEREEEQARQKNYPSLAPELAKRANIKESLALKMLTPDFMGRVGCPDYALKNNGAEIRRLKARIEDLKKKQTEAIQVGNEKIEYSGDIKVIINRDENRVQISFPLKPAESTRKILKSYGFKWSPYNQVWQRLLNTTAIWNAQTILGQIGAVKVETEAQIAEEVQPMQETPTAPNEPAQEEIGAAPEETNEEALAWYEQTQYSDLYCKIEGRAEFLFITRNEIDYWWQGDTNVYPYEWRQPISLALAAILDKFTITPAFLGSSTMVANKLMGNLGWQPVRYFNETNSVQANYEAARLWIRGTHANAVIYGEGPQPEEEESEAQPSQLSLF